MGYTIKENQEYLVCGTEGKVFVSKSNSEYKLINNNISTTYTDPKELVNIIIYGNNLTISIETLYLIAGHKLNFVKGYEQYIKYLKFYKFDKQHSRDKISYNIMFATPVYYHKDNNYRVIAACPRYCINTSGNIIDILTGESIEYRHNQIYKYYPYVSLALLRGVKKFTYHRLLGLTWVDNKEPNIKFFIDHINGNKTDNRIENLRWVTITENNAYAPGQGLKSDNKICLLKDLVNDKYYEFPSTTQASVFLGRSRFTLRLTNRNIFNYNPQVVKTRKGIFQIRTIGDKTPWITLEEWKNINYTYERPLLVLARNGKEIAKFNNTHSMCLYLGIYDTIEPDLVKIKDMFLEKFPGHTVIITFELVSEKPIGYIAKNEKTGEIIYKRTINEIAKIACTHPSSITKSATNDGSYMYNGWRVKYDNGRPFKDLINIANKPITFKVIDTKENKSYIFPSLRQTSYFLNTDKKTVSKRVDNEELFKDRYLIATVKEEH